MTTTTTTTKETTMNTADTVTVSLTIIDWRGERTRSTTFPARDILTRCARWHRCLRIVIEDSGWTYYSSERLRREDELRAAYLSRPLVKDLFARCYPPAA